MAVCGFSALAGLSACGSGGDLALLWPELSSETETVFLVIATDIALHVEALGASELETYRYDLEGADRDELTISLIESKTTLEAFGIEPGPVTASRGDVCFGRALPTDGLVYRYDVDAGAWRSSRELAPRLSSFRFLVPCPCLDFRLDRAYSLGSPALQHGLFGAVLQDEWIGLSDFGVVRIDLTRTSTGALEQSPLPTDPGILRQVWIDPAQQIWVMSETSLYRWNGVGEAELISTIADAEERYMGARAFSVGDDYEAYVALEERRVERRTKTTTVVLHDGAQLGKDSFQQGQVVILGPDHAVFALHDDRGVGTYVEGEVNVELGPGAIWSMAPMAESIVLGDRYSEMALLDPETLEHSRLAGLDGHATVGRESIESLEPYGQGVVAMSRDGFFAQILPELGLCPSIATTGFVETQSLLVRGEELVVSGRGREGRHRVEVWRPE